MGARILEEISRPLAQHHVKLEERLGDWMVQQQDATKSWFGNGTSQYPPAGPIFADSVVAACSEIRTMEEIIEVVDDTMDEHLRYWMKALWRILLKLMTLQSSGTISDSCNMIVTHLPFRISWRSNQELL